MRARKRMKERQNNAVRNGIFLSIRQNLYSTPSKSNYHGGGGLKEKRQIKI